MLPHYTVPCGAFYVHLCETARRSAAASPLITIVNLINFMNPKLWPFSIVHGWRRIGWMAHFLQISRLIAPYNNGEPYKTHLRTKEVPFWFNGIVHTGKTIRICMTCHAIILFSHASSVTKQDDKRNADKDLGTGLWKWSWNDEVSFRCWLAGAAVWKTWIWVFCWMGCSVITLNELWTLIWLSGGAAPWEGGLLEIEQEEILNLF